MFVRLLPVLAVVASQAVLCPTKETAFHASISKQGKQATFAFKNEAGMDVSLWWVDFEGKELYRGVTGAAESSGNLGTFPGHVFNVRCLLDDRLLLSFRAGDVDHPNEPLVVGDCGFQKEMGDKVMDKSRWPEFEKLAAKANQPCEGESGDWSCEMDNWNCESGDINCECMIGIVNWMI